MAECTWKSEPLLLNDMTEKDFKETLESYRSLSLGGLRELERNLTQGMKDQIKELRDAFKGLPSERGTTTDATGERFLGWRQAWADAMFIVLFLH